MTIHTSVCKSHQYNPYLCRCICKWNCHVEEKIVKVKQILATIQNMCVLSTSIQYTCLPTPGVCLSSMVAMANLPIKKVAAQCVCNKHGMTSVTNLIKVLKS